MKFVHALVLLNVVFAVSCGNKSGSDGKKEVWIEQSQIDKAMASQKFDCSTLSTSSCPDGVARLMMLNPRNAKKSGVCSGFMVSEDTMITNNHCIPDPETCKNTYIAIYNGGSYEQARCSKFIKTFKDYKTGDPRKTLDTTIVKIDKKWAGKVFKLSEERAREGDQVSAWVVDHIGVDRSENPNLYDSRITEFNCTVASVNNKESMILSHCPMVPGNSGSPVVNDRGEIVGIIWGTTAHGIDSTYDLPSRRYRSDYGLATEVHHFRSYITQ